MRNSSPAQQTALYDLTTYLRDYGGYFHTMCFSRIPFPGTAQAVPFVSDVCDTALGCGGSIGRTKAVTMPYICRRPFRRRPHLFPVSREDDYQKRLAAWLAELRCRLEVPIVVTVYMLALPEYMYWFYFVSNRIYWSCQFHFKKHNREHEKCLLGGRSLRFLVYAPLKGLVVIILFWIGCGSMKCRCCCLGRRHLFYFSIVGWLCKGSVDDQNCIMTALLSEYLLMTGVMFVINAKDVIYPNSYTYNSQFDHFEDSLLFWLPPKDSRYPEVLRIVK